MCEIEFGFKSMELQNTVKEALNALYHHPDDAVRVQADRWLQDFQRTIDAWQVIRHRGMLPLSICELPWGRSRFDGLAVLHFWWKQVTGLASLLGADCSALDEI